MDGNGVEVKEFDSEPGKEVVETPGAQAEQPAEQAGAGSEAAAATPAPSPEEIIANLTAERDRLAQDKASLYDQLLRKQADFENFRKRIEREKSEFRVQASMEVVRSILPVLDGLERALVVASEDDAGPEFRRGIEMLQKQFLETLQKLGLEPIEARGQIFDPHIHHAVEMVETEEHEDQSVVEECQRGYWFQRRLLRPAMVRVAVRPVKN